MRSGLEQPSNSLNLVKSAAAADITFLDEIASPNTYPCQSVGQSVGDSFRFGDSYHISEFCELVIHDDNES